MSLTLYGIPNCNSIKKARMWLEGEGIPYHFHDYRKEGLDPALLDQWLEYFGWEQLINRKGTTWRQLPETTRNQMDTALARTLILDKPTLIKRPLLESDNTRLLGFDAETYAAHMAGDT